MRIAINALGYGGNTLRPAVLNILFSGKTGHDLLLITDQQPAFAVPPGLRVHVTASRVNNLLAKRWWLDMTLASEIKKSRADVLINLDGNCCLRTRTPQVLCISNMLFLHHADRFSSAERLFIKFYFPRYLKCAKAVVVPSVCLKKDILAHFNVPGDTISVIPTITNPGFKEIDWERKSQVKDGYADGREYFLFTCGLEPVTNLVAVLKAFSRFKKWQHSNMKLLVIAGGNNELAAKLSTYKFRDDVVLLHDISTTQFVQLVGAAYAMLYLPLYDGDGVTVAEAMQSGTPVIASDIAAIREKGGAVVLYADPQNEAALADQMIKLYKDETLRAELVAAGISIAQKYNEAASVQNILHLVESCIRDHKE